MPSCKALLVEAVVLFYKCRYAFRGWYAVVQEREAMIESSQEFKAW